MFLKEMYKSMGIALDVRNIVVDYRLKDGTDAHVARQVIGNGVNVSDEDIISFSREHLPAGSRLCCIHEIEGDYELQELAALAETSLSLLLPRRCVYVDKEMLVKCAEEMRCGK